MLTIANAPICKFVDFVNEEYPTDEEVTILVVPCENDLFNGENGDKNLGYYYRNNDPDEPHVIILSDSLNYEETVEVLIHEYNHHRLYNKMVDEKGNYDETHNDMFWGICKSMEKKFYKWLKKEMEE